MLQSVKANKEFLLDQIFSLVRSLTFHAIGETQRMQIAQAFSALGSDPRDTNIGCQLSNDKGVMKIELTLSSKPIPPAPRIIGLS